MTAPLPQGKCLVLRTCQHDMSASHGFVWPKSGPVEAPDWNPAPHPGGGLHGLLWGVGEPIYFHQSPDANWLVVEVDSDKIVLLHDKCKFPSGVVVYCGTREGATNYIREHGGALKPIANGIFSVGDGKSALAGPEGIVASGVSGQSRTEDRGVSASGDHGLAYATDSAVAAAGSSGHAQVNARSVAAVGEEGTAIGRDRSVVAGGECSFLTVGECGICANLGGGKVMAGDEGIAVSGPYGEAIAGNGGLAIGSNSSIARAGNYGTAIAGLNGRAAAGEHGVIVICSHTGHYGARSLIVGRVGHDGILPHVLYCLRNGQLSRADEGAEVPQDALG